MDDSAQIAEALANVSEEAYNLQSEDVVLVSILLERVANSTDVQGNLEVRGLCYCRIIIFMMVFRKIKS